MTVTAAAPLMTQPAPPAEPAEPEAAGEHKIVKLLHRTLGMDASDLHLTVGTTPWVTRHGAMDRMEGLARELDSGTIVRTLKEMVSEDDWRKFAANKRLDFSYATPLSRFRCHFAVADGQPMAVFRAIPTDAPDFETLGLPPQIADFADLESGLVLFIGVTNSGKSSSLASLIKRAKNKHAKKITTVEAPVEYKHPHGRSLVVQREVGKDVDSFSLGIEDAMREAPDIILVGEMRDADTMSAAISAATSGHLVFSTLHAESTADAATRILDSVPPERVAEVRAQLSRSLRAVVYQKLLPVKGGGGRVVATEVMMVDAAISNMIRSNKLEGIRSQLHAKETGSIAFEVSLVNLVLDGTINESVALRAELEEGSYRRQKEAGRR